MPNLSEANPNPTEVSRARRVYQIIEDVLKLNPNVTLEQYESLFPALGLTAEEDTTAAMDYYYVRAFGSLLTPAPREFSLPDHSENKKK